MFRNGALAGPNGNFLPGSRVRIQGRCAVFSGRKNEAGGGMQGGARPGLFAPELKVRNGTDVGSAYDPIGKRPH